MSRVAPHYSRPQRTVVVDVPTDQPLRRVAADQSLRQVAADQPLGRVGGGSATVSSGGGSATASSGSGSATAAQAINCIRAPPGHKLYSMQRKSHVMRIFVSMVWKMS